MRTLVEFSYGYLELRLMSLPLPVVCQHIIHLVIIIEEMANTMTLNLSSVFNDSHMLQNDWKPVFLFSELIKKKPG